MKKLIVPAIIAKDQKLLDKRLNNVKDKVSLIQLDVMDGKFVKNSSLNFNFKIPKTKAKFEAHLMVKDPLKWLKKHIKKIDTVIIHFESKNLDKAIDFAKKKKKKIGLALNPKTKVTDVLPYLHKIDQVLILTVNPGFYGSKFLPKNLKKVKEIKNFKHNLILEVDGGMSPKTIKQAAKAGTDLFVSGSYTVDSKDPAKALKILKNNIKH